MERLAPRRRAEGLYWGSKGPNVQDKVVPKKWYCGTTVSYRIQFSECVFSQCQSMFRWTMGLISAADDMVASAMMSFMMNAWFWCWLWCW